jgi:hypothetical protein
MGNQCAIVIERPPSTAVYTICAAMATEMLDVTEAKATTTLNRTTPDQTELLEPSIPSEGADDTMPRRMVAACGERPSGPSPAWACTRDREWGRGRNPGWGRARGYVVAAALGLFER